MIKKNHKKLIFISELDGNIEVLFNYTRIKLFRII